MIYNTLHFKRLFSKNLSRVLILTLIIVMPGLLLSCEEADSRDKTKSENTMQEPVEPLSDNTGKLTGFSYSFGSFFGETLSYRIFEHNGKLYLEASGFNATPLDEKGEVPEDTLERLSVIIEAVGIKEWHGFSSDSDVLDGYGFGLEAVYENDILTASAYHVMPDNYERGHRSLAGFLEELTNSLPPLILTENNVVKRLNIDLEDQRALYMRADRGYIEWWDGLGEPEQVSFDELPPGVVSPEELIALAVEYHNEYSSAPYRRARHDRGYSRNMYISVSDEVFFSRNINIYTDADDGGAFDKIVEIMLSYFGLTPTGIGYVSNSEYQRMTRIEQFTWAEFLVFDMGRNIDITVNLHDLTLMSNGVPSPINTMTAEAFHQSMDKLDRGLLNSETHISGNDTGLFSGWDGLIAESRFSYRKTDYLWVFGRFSLRTTEFRESAQTYGGFVYEEDWDEVIHAVEELLQFRTPTSSQEFLNEGIKPVVIIDGEEYDKNSMNLEFRDMGLSDINFISEFYRVDFIDLRDNRISDLEPLSEMHELRDIMLSNNQISNLEPLNGLSGLRYLSLSENQVSDIKPLRGLSSLSELRINNNNISDISPLSGLTNLRMLDINENRVSDITPLRRLTNLQTLRLRDNEIQDISVLSGLTELSSLDLSDNQISDITVLHGLTNLQTVFLSGNPLTQEQIDELERSIDANVSFIG